MAVPTGEFFIGLAFRETNGAGWVSVYYPKKDTYPQMMVQLQALNTAELNCLHTSVTCNRLTVSDIGKPGDVYPDVPTKGSGSVAGIDGPTDEAIALPVKQISGVDSFSVKFLRGVPAKFFVPGEPAHFTILAADLPPFDAYLEALAGFNNIYSRPGKRNNFTAAIHPVTKAIWFTRTPGYRAVTRKAGRPFDLRRGRRRTG